MQSEHNQHSARRNARTVRRWILAGIGAVCLGAVSPANAGDTSLLKDLERERAALLGVLLDPDRTAVQREEYVRAAAPRLADMERIVLRDDQLVGDSSPVVRRAFMDYELTFLVHASAERERSMLELWLARLGLSSDAVMSAKPGRRP